MEIYIYIYLQLIHTVMWQQPKQNCKMIALQLKIKIKKKISVTCRTSSAHKPYFNFKMRPWSLELIT